MILEPTNSLWLRSVTQVIIMNRMISRVLIGLIGKLFAIKNCDQLKTIEVYKHEKLEGDVEK